MNDDPFLSPNNSLLSGPKKGKRNLDDSAMVANVLEDQELSQILNPNIKRMVDNPVLLLNHPNTLKTKQFLRKNFMSVEAMLNRMKKNAMANAYDDIKTDSMNKQEAMNHLKKKIDAKRRKREGIKKLGVLAKIYQKQHSSRAIERWVEALERLRALQSDKQRLAHLFVVMMGYKSKDLMRISLRKLLELEQILEKEKEARLKEEANKILDEAQKERRFRNLHETIRRLVNLRQKDALGKITREATYPYGGVRRKNDYAKTVALMLISHLVEKEALKKEEEGFDSLKEYNEHLEQNPKKLAIIQGLKKLKNQARDIEKRIWGKRLISHLKIKNNRAIRKGLSNMFDALAKYERRVKIGVFRNIFGQNIDLLKYQKLCTYFAGLFGRLVKSNRRRNLEYCFEQIKKLNHFAKIRKANAKAMVTKLARIVSSLKGDVFKKLTMVPAVQEMFDHERNKYERSIKLRGALKVGNSMAVYYRKFLFEKVRKTFSFLRRFNHRFKVPLYHQGLEKFRQLYEEKKKNSLDLGFQRLKGRATFYLLQRFFKDNIDIGEGLNEDVIFALEHNVPSKSDKINKMIEFWNTTYDTDDAPALERDTPDDLPMMDIEDPRLNMGSHHSSNQFRNTMMSTVSANKIGTAQKSDQYRLKNGNSMIGRSTGVLSNAAEPYPHNRHSEICSIHSNHHVKNILSPITRPRVKEALNLKENDSPQREYGSGRKRTNKSPSKSRNDQQTTGPERRIFNDNKMDDPELNNFENFLQLSAQNSLNNSQAFSHFDSFSNKKPLSSDLYEDAFKESMALTNFLEESKKKGKDKSSNIFHH